MFHLRKADRSISPRRRDFNVLYRKYCDEHFGARNGVEMFEKLEEKILSFKENIKDVKIKYQMYDKEERSSLIIAILTPLMERVHTMVRLTFNFIQICLDNKI